MKKIIDDRLSVIIALVFGGSSGIGINLSGFIAAAEIKQWLTTLAIAFSLIVSLIISAYYKANKRNLGKKRFWKYSVISAAIFLVMMVSFFTSYNSFETRLNIRYDSTNVKNDSVFIAGLYYSKQASNEIAFLKKQNPANENILQMVFNDSGGKYIQNIWSNTSRMYAKLIILLFYVFFIASFVSALTVTTEIIQDGVTTKKLPAKNN